MLTVHNEVRTVMEKHKIFGLHILSDLHITVSIPKTQAAICDWAIEERENFMS